jgi:probable phosphomutase (TIGR03848 family)
MSGSPVFTVLLVRHGATDVVGKRVTGRLPGVHLNAQGREQVARLAERLRGRSIAAVYTSPMERAVETAAAIAERVGRSASVVEGLTEMDFGSWSGTPLEQLDRLEPWKRFNVNRTGTRAPGGEHIVEVQERMVVAIEALRERHREGTIVVVSHGDPLKTVVAYYVGFSLELLPRIDISPASVTELALGDWGPTLRTLNVAPGAA